MNKIRRGRQVAKTLAKTASLLVKARIPIVFLANYNKRSILPGHKGVYPGFQIANTQTWRQGKRAVAVAVTSERPRIMIICLAKT